MKLTPREIEVMWLLVEGLSVKQVADRMGLSYHTAKFHVQNATTKLGNGSRERAIANLVSAAPVEARMRLGLAAVTTPPVGLSLTTEPRTIDYCAKCGHSPDSAVHLFQGARDSHDYVDPRDLVDARELVSLSS